MSNAIIDETEDLPQLSEVEGKFVTGICQGLGIVEAYYRAAPDSDGEQAHLVAKRAYKMNQRGHVIEWVAAMKRIRACKVNETVEDHVMSLAELRDEARLDGQYSAAVSAQAHIGKALGHGEQRPAQLEGRRLDHEIVATIGKLLGDTFAEAAARKLGVETPEPRRPRRGTAIRGSAPRRTSRRRRSRHTSLAARLQSQL